MNNMNIAFKNLIIQLKSFISLNELVKQFINSIRYILSEIKSVEILNQNELHLDFIKVFVHKYFSYIFFEEKKSENF